MKCPCGSDPSIARITVDGSEVGIAGLDQIFQAWKIGGKKPQDLTNEEIIKALQRHNYIVPRLEGEYAHAIRARYEAVAGKKS